MPIILNGPGGGGAAGYVYPSGCVENPVLSDANGKISIQWADPDEIMLNGVAISEWKGTVIVCKQGARPQSVDDGVVVCESTVKNQHKESPLVTDVGGIGYYYGFFPYTKDYVVNTDAANVVYYNGGLLEYSSWDEIAAAAADGSASTRWNVGDEKTITLTGVYAGDVIVQIAGFNHDPIWVGSGNAGITFISKNTVGELASSSAVWADSNWRKKVMLDIKSSLPEQVQKHVKNVRKEAQRSASYDSGVSVSSYEESVFIPSVTEVNLSKTAGSGNKPIIEGSAYPIFTGAESRRKYDLNGSLSEWWLRTAFPSATNYLCTCYINTKAGLDYAYPSSGQKGICFCFCI